MTRIFFYIKYLKKPSNYMLIFISSLFVAFALSLSSFYFSTILYKEINNSKFLVLIPKVQNDMETKRDLVFKILSLNKEIDYIKEIPKVDILKLFTEDLNGGLVSEDEIPEILQVFTKKNKDIDQDNIREKINDIYKDILIIKQSNEKELIVKKYLYISFVFLIILQIVLCFCIDTSIKAQKKLIDLLRLLGSAESAILINIYLNYCAIILLGFILGVCSSILFLVEVNAQNIFQNNFIEVLGISCVFNVSLLIIYIFYKYRKNI